MDAGDAEEVKLAVTQFLQGFEVGLDPGAQELLGGEGRRPLVASGIGFLGVASGVDLQRDLLGVVEFQRTGFGVLDLAEWGLVAALVVGEKLGVELITQGPEASFQIGQRDFGGGVLGQEFLGGGELDGLDLGLGSFESCTEDGVFAKDR